MPVLSPEIAVATPLGSIDLREIVLGSPLSVDSVLYDGKKSYPMSRRVRTIAKSAFYLRRVHPALCPYVSARPSPDGFP